MVKSKQKRNHSASVALGYAKASSYEEILAVLSSAHADLPKRLKQVAIYLTQHPEEVALGTVGSVSKQAGVQPSALVRFSQFFGFAGFTDLQDIFKAHVRAGQVEKLVPRSRSFGKRKSGHQIPIQGHIGAARESLARLEATFEVDSFQRIVETLSMANAIYLVGSKRAFPVANYMSLTFSQLGIKNMLVDNVGSTAFDQVACLEENDSVLAISFSPYNSITPELAMRAKDQGAKVVSLTDSMLSPLIPISRACLVVVEDSEAGFRSMAATNVAALSLVLAVAEKRASMKKGRKSR